jgi:cytochrome c-type biogenesis protein
MGLLNIPFLNFEKKKFISNKPRGIFGAFIIGITFAAAWTPCIGPILSSILILAATEESALRGVALLTAYSFGLGIPFIFAVAAYGYFMSFSTFMKKNIKTIKLLSGLLLLGLGLLLVMGQFTRMSQFLSFFIAVVAGFVSFVSPCVLPLIPSYLTFITGVSLTEIARAEGT